MSRRSAVLERGGVVRGYVFAVRKRRVRAKTTFFARHVLRENHRLSLKGLYAPTLSLACRALALRSTYSMICTATLRFVNVSGVLRLADELTSSTSGPFSERIMSTPQIGRPIAFAALTAVFSSSSVSLTLRPTPP